VPVAALDRGIEATLRNDRRVVIVSLALVAALAWIYLWRDAVGMDDMSRQMDMSFPMAMTPDFALTFAMWATMMVGMMLPSAAPTILLYATLVRKQSEASPALAAGWIFTAGYLAAWTAFSLLAAALQVGLEHAMLLSSMMVSVNQALSAAILIGAGVYQVLPLKDICLTTCRNPLLFLTTHWRAGKLGAFRMGAEHGLYCVGCCWTLMLVLFVAGVMNLLWVALIAAFVFIEKLLPFAHYTSRVASLTLVGAGIVIAVA
jgi:predicted metal-binding membrane protein